jgi:tRNA-dihydrouridine synthase B
MEKFITPDTPWLAPLAGFSDLPFRLLCREHGCSVAVTEMISAKGLMYGSPGTADLLRTCAEDTPLVVQLFGSEESFLVRAIERLRQAGHMYFDLNCGCSVRKVVKTGSGAALLREPENLARLAGPLIRAAAPGKMGFKIRLGWKEPVYLPLAVALENQGAAWIAMHPRLGVQGFTGSADWTHLTRLKETLSIPVIAGGDLFSAEDGIRCMEQTGADGLMFARGALNDPEIFSRYLALRRGETPPPKTHTRALALIRRLSQLYIAHGMDRQGLLKMRTLAPRFLKGLPGARELRRDIVFCTTWDQVFDIFHKHFRGQEEKWN